MADRPDPDALLAQLKEEERSNGRGRIKIYLGMAAGVGKTYAMLSDGQEAKRRGEDVVIGYVEPHGRPETEALTVGLEQVPLATHDYRGVSIKEFDLDAAVRRKPQLVLVDELAHSNAPGARHKKRWQDVQELLQEGIDVFTTVNIQHIESLNDVVAQITGIVVTETIPDSLVYDADEVEVVDIPPQELIQRLHEGKVYVPTKVDQALSSFFKKSNLSALRELALRHTAERVDRQVRTYRAAEGALEPWHTKERIVVCVGPNKMSLRVVRAAARMAGTLHAELIAVSVDSPRQSMLGEADRVRVVEALRLAENLGAETVTLSGQDIVSEVIRFAQSRNVTTIMVGKPIRHRWRELVFGSVVDTMVRHSGDINVLVITGTDTTGTPQRLIPKQTERTDWRGYGLAAGVTLAATGICSLMFNRFERINLVMVYLLGVTYVASRKSRWAATLAAFLAVGTFDFFFVPPTKSFAVSDVQYIFTFAVMLVVALLTSTLTARLREQTVAASIRERRTAALFNLSRKLSATRSRIEIGTFTAAKIKEVFGCDVGVLIKSRATGKLFSGPESESKFEFKPNENAVALWVLDHGKMAGAGTDTLPGSEGLFLPLNAENGCVGVLAVKWTGDPVRDPAQLHFLENFANQLAVAVERTNLAKDSHQAMLQVEKERLRNSLLSSVSHDLRTPLTIISGAADRLRESVHLTDSRDLELAQAIAVESERLGRQVRNLLDMTRLDSGGVELNREWQSIEELVGSALSRTEHLLQCHIVKTELAADIPLLMVDGVLVEQAIVNLLENAARHTPAGTEVKVSAHTTPGQVILEVANNGPCLAEGEEDRIFDKFYRTSPKATQGFGLGLTICKSIMEAHGGTIRAINNQEGGVSFMMTLPMSESVPEVPLG
ncbi:MAG: sensor histidine kinase KdpD [Fimbriimonas sp.]|nr:sensor histidine kinase KdpD [Fimbriimonas sp.]